MSTKPKILVSNPPSILMPATCLHRTGNRESKKYNEAKSDILLPALRLHCIISASLSILNCPNDLGILSKPQRGQRKVDPNKKM
jgi:hypothetical protein